MNNPRKELNILLLGQTGCGKTTFINALCNYFQYTTFDDALHKLRNLHIVIPTKYSWTLPNYEQVDVVLGEDDNECREGVGVSATQWPREIVYNYGDDYIIRLIDTPGFADTSGIDRDIINSERILKFIHQYSDLHAVCILFKPNETRNTNLFRYCFNTLFTQMHRNIFKNIICLFTFTKGTNFQPGETLALLRDGLHQVQESQGVDNVDMSLGLHNIVCFENDCFNFLGAVKKGVCDTTDKDNYLISWERSSKAANNLVEMVKRLKPYSVIKLTSLQKVRQESMELAKIYKELQDDIEIQSEKLESMSAKVEGVEKRIQELTPFTYDITKHRKEGLFILCVNAKCRKRDDLGNYNICRNDSGPWGSFLKFDMLRITCQYCNCKMHYHSKVTHITIQKRVVNERCKELITKEMIKRNQAKLDLQKCFIDTNKLKNEKEILNMVLLQISTHISKNSMVSYKGMSTQINVDIESEKTKQTPNVHKIQRLEEELQMQQHLNDLQFQFTGRLDDIPSIEEINDALLSLETLPYIGPKMKELYTDIRTAMNNPRKELNILLLGQTGCGKTTFINALCNYFQYTTFDDALHKLRNLHIVIPTRYSWTLPNYEQVDVVLGEHDNECREGVGVSATQWPREIVYNHGNDYIIGLIDTPGFADTSGTDKDSINSERILKFIHRYSDLHAVCILFKPNETRNTNLFRYCFETLFKQMHRNIFKNIICVFTFTKGTNFQPGETLALLRDGLRQIQESQGVDNVDMMTLGPHNIVCFENDCFNFLGAVKKEACNTTDKDNYLMSWERSSKAANTLVEKVKNFKPYSVNELTSLQKVRQDSMKLIKIYKELRDELEIQCEELESMLTQLEAAERRIQDLISLTYHIKKNTKEGKFILCFNKKCEKRDDLGNHNMCRNDSNAWGSFLKFDMLGNICKYCNCDLRYHSDVTEFTIKEREVNKTCEELKTVQIVKRNKAKLELIKCRIEICNLKHEKQILHKLLHQISTYITKNSMISSDNMSNQINLDIESEKTKENPNFRKILQLQEDLKMQQLLNELHDEFKDGLDGSTEDINEKLESLQTLPYIGPKIQELYVADQDSSSYYESLIVNPDH